MKTKSSTTKNEITTKKTSIAASSKKINYFQEKEEAKKQRFSRIKKLNVKLKIDNVTLKTKVSLPQQIKLCH